MPDIPIICDEFVQPSLLTRHRENEVLGYRPMSTPILTQEMWFCARVCSSHIGFDIVTYTKSGISYQMKKKIVVIVPQL